MPRSGAWHAFCFLRRVCAGCCVRGMTETDNILRARARRALAAARPFAGDEDEPSEPSSPALDGDVLAVYSAPIEPDGQRAQAAFGAGSITADALSRGGSLIDRDALDRAASQLEPGVYSMFMAFEIDGALVKGNPAGKWSERTRVDVVVTGSPSERGDAIVRALHDAAKARIKENSDLLINLLESVLLPDGATAGIETGRFPARERDVVPPPKPLDRSERATLQRRDKLGRFAAKPKRKPAAKPKRKPAAKPAAKPKRKPAAKPAAKPKRKPAAKPKRKPAAKPKSKPKAKPKAKTRAR